MISWIVATHNRDTLRDNLLSSLGNVVEDEMVVVEDAPSIAAAYNEGTRRATRYVRCYIHHDVQILNVTRLRVLLMATCRADVGMVGLIGSRTPAVPWWEGDRCGSVRDARLGVLDFGPGGNCSYLDGLLLATAQTTEWDESIPEWHIYDHDMCQQMLHRRLHNVCLTGGKDLVLHNTTGPTDTGRLTSWDAAVKTLGKKWHGHTD